MQKHTIFLITILAFFLPAYVQADWVDLNSSPDPFTVEVLELAAERTVLKFSVNRYLTGTVDIDGKAFISLQKLRKESMIEEAGSPRLPRINRALVIPDNGRMGYKVISSSYIEIEDIDVAPSKGHLLRTVDPATVLYTFGDVYENNAFFPGDLVKLREPHILRDFRGIVLELNAFQYNPVTRTLRIYTDVTLEVTKTAPGGINTLQRRKPLKKIDPQFEKFYRRHFLNFSGLDYPLLPESGSLLIICYDDFMTTMAPFVEWKNQKGLPTEIVPVSEVGSTSDQIKSYVRTYYFENDLGYLLIVGDHLQVPTFISGSDPVYSLLSGTDSYPEIFVGRFSAENQAQVETQVQRTITYEKYPDPEGDWYHMGLGDADESGPCNPEQYDFQHITNIALDLLRWNYTQMDSVYTTFGGTTAMISHFLNEGRSIFNYAGHGWIQGVGPVDFTSSDINALVNDNKLTHFVAIACEPGNFQNTTCMGEAWLRATNDVTGEPTGAIAVYLSKISQTWFPPYDMQDEGVDLLCADSMLTFGGMCFNGSGLMIDLWPLGPYEFENWTIFGDPSVFLRSTTPYELSVIHNTFLPLGTSNFTVTVNGPGGAFEGAMVCGMNENIYANGITDASGQVTLTFDPPPGQIGTFTLTVTTANAIPYITEVDLVVLSGAYVIYNNHTVQDDLTGNNNGQLDYGETVELAITVENAGLANAENVFVVLSTQDPLITTGRDSVYIGTVNALDSITVDRAFEFSVAPEVEDGHNVAFLLSASDGVDVWESYFAVSAHAPECEYISNTISDPPPGNQNGNLDPGESGEITVTVINNGSSNVADLVVELTANDPYVTITSAAAYLSVLSPGTSADIDFDITASLTCPQGHTAPLNLAFSGGGYYATDNFTIIIGDQIYAPSGPDNYGYMAYDLNDYPEFPVYDWVEICADSGGPGTLVPFVEDEQVFHYALPFEFQYYGVEYDSFTVAANGWIGMGAVGPDDYSNSGIPDGDGPSSMIAAYWEDLRPQWPIGGEVWTWYDDVEHRLVIEYNYIAQYAPATSFETFQAILYDPAHHPTLTGDGRILMQYKQMSAAFQTEGTIGIENHDETDGIQFFFDGNYDPKATPIENGMAVLYTTPASSPDLSITLTPQGAPIVIPSGGGSFDFDLLIENGGSSTEIFDAWIDVTLPNGSNFGPIILREDLFLMSGETLSRSLNQAVPAAAPAGDYTYYGKVGLHPNAVFNSDSFPFEKQSGETMDPPDGEWILTGWEDLTNSTITSTEIPAEFALLPNYPNPFNPVTTISFALPEASKVELRVYDISGKLVKELISGWRQAGVHDVTFEAPNLSSGIYIYRLNADNFEASGKMLLIK
jgi:hypothetical protein